MQKNKLQYASVPAERPSKYPGIPEGLSSIVCAIISLFFFPPIFGITGIVLGLRSRKRGAKIFGIITIICSIIFMIIGINLNL